MGKYGRVCERVYERVYERMYEWVWVWEVSVGGKCRRVCEGVGVCGSGYGSGYGREGGREGEGGEMKVRDCSYNQLVSHNGERLIMHIPTCCANGDCN